MYMYEIVMHLIFMYLEKPVTYEKNGDLKSLSKRLFF